MKKWIPRILAYIIMLPIVAIGLIGGIIWNVVLIMDYIFRDVKRSYKKELKTIQQNDKKREEGYKQ